jgi:hypothetical protein
MKRHAFALCIHPCKDILLPEEVLKQELRRFVHNLLELMAGHSALRFNLIFPGSLLHLIDPIQLAGLREVQKADRLEWLTSGCTEPFISFSPSWLNQENIKQGQEVFNELAGYRPVGYVPPFSNWEPSLIDTLRDCGMQYAVVARSLFSRKERNCCGYWITEQGGATIPIFPAQVCHHATAPVAIAEWLEHTFKADPIKTSEIRLVTIDYILPLTPVNGGSDPFDWIKTVANAMDSLLVKYQFIRLSEFPSMSYPLGQQYIPSSLVFSRGGEEKTNNFYNLLHTYDQVSILQRKMLDVADSLKPLIGQKKIAPLMRELFSAQDINRYLPAAQSGFPHAHDREWTYARLIDIENQLRELDKVHGCQLRVADFLRNGTKCIILSNKSLKAYIDHKGGGQLFELDIRERLLNLCAGYNPRPLRTPRILSAGMSRTSFIDIFLDIGCTHQAFRESNGVQNGDFVAGQFQYKVKKDDKGVKAILSRQGVITIAEKTYPLFMEKAFGLGEEGAALSFVYQLSNPSLTSFAFKFAVSLTLALPGLLTGQATMMAEKRVYKNLSDDPLTLEGLTNWAIYDPAAGVSLHFNVQKAVDVWCFPTPQEGEEKSGTLTFIISAPVSLQENSVWSLIGKMAYKKIRLKGNLHDAV